MKTILLAGYRNDDTLDNVPGLQREPDGELRLDRRIAQLRALDHHVICVVSGAAAEQQLRRARRLEDVDLVYDTNAPAVTLMTNLRSGLAAVDGEACFCLPVELPFPPASVWTSLTRAARAEPAAASLVQVGQPEGVDDFGFPLLITRAGVTRLAQLPELASLTDPRLEYLYLQL